MKSKILKERLIISVATILLIISINFLVLNLMPGDPLMNIIGSEDYYKIKANSPELLEEIRSDYDLDKPLYIRYFKFLKKIFTLDFGYSYSKNRPVIDIVLFRMKWTLALALPSTILSALIGGWLGLKAGWNENGLVNKIGSPIFIFLNTIPTNALSIIFLSIFAYNSGIFPISGMASGSLEGIDYFLDVLWHMALPLSVLVILSSSGNFLNMKSYIINVKNEEYILNAYAKGLSDKRVLKIHGFKNAILPFLTLVCMQFGNIFSGSIVIEVAFSWLGMGTLINQAMSSSDFPILHLSFLIIAVCIVISNLLADILNIIIDPRLRED